MKNKLIEFRAYYKKTETIYPVLSYGSEFTVILSDNEFAPGRRKDLSINMYDKYNYDYSFEIPTKKLIIMQYTNKKDKNNIKVFEDDIIKYKWNPVMDEPSVMDMFTFHDLVEYDDEWCCFVVKGETKEEFKLAIGSPLEIEIMGNKWMNPELLKKI